MKYNVSINVSEVQEPNGDASAGTINQYYNGNGVNINKVVEAESEVAAVDQLVEKFRKLSV